MTFHNPVPQEMDLVSKNLPIKPQNCPLLSLPCELLLEVIGFLVTEPKGLWYNYSKPILNEDSSENGVVNVGQLYQASNPSNSISNSNSSAVVSHMQQQQQEQQQQNARISRLTSPIAKTVFAQLLATRAYSNSRSQSSSSPVTGSPIKHCRDAICDFEGYTSPKDLINLASTCKFMRNAVGSIIWKNVTLGDRSCGQLNRSTLIKSSQEPGSWKFSFHNNVSSDILCHVSHLQLDIGISVQLHLNNIDYNCSQGTLQHSGLPTWIKVLQQNLTPKLETVILICTGQNTEGLGIKYLTEMAHKYLTEDREPSMYPKLSLIADFETPLMFFHDDFLNLVSSMEITLDDNECRLNQISKCIHQMENLSDLSIMSMDPQNDNSGISKNTKLTLPDSIKRLALNDNDVCPLSEIPLSVSSLICNLGTIIPSEPVLTNQFYNFNNITELCLNGLYHSDNLLENQGPQNLWKGISSVEFPNLQFLVLQGSTNNNMTPSIISTSVFTSHFNTKTIDSILYSFLAKNGAKIRKLYTRGLSKPFSITAIKYLPELIEYHIESYCDVPHGVSSIDEVLCPCEIKTEDQVNNTNLMMNEKMTGNVCPFLNRLCLPNDNDNGPGLKPDSRPITFLDYFFDALAESKCSSSLNVLSVRIPDLFFMNKIHPSFSSVRFLESCISRMPKLVKLLLLDNVSSSTAPFNDYLFSAKQEEGQQTKQLSSIFTRMDRFSSSPCVIFKNNLEFTDQLRKFESYRVRTQDLSSGLSFSLQSSSSSPSSSSLLPSPFSPLTKRKTSLPVSLEKTTQTNKTKSNQFLRPNWDNPLIAKHINLDILRS